MNLIHFLKEHNIRKLNKRLRNGFLSGKKVLKESPSKLAYPSVVFSIEFFKIIKFLLKKKLDDSVLSKMQPLWIFSKQTEKPLRRLSREVLYLMGWYWTEDRILIAFQSTTISMKCSRRNLLIWILTFDSSLTTSKNLRFTLFFTGFPHAKHKICVIISSLLQWRYGSLRSNMNIDTF